MIRQLTPKEERQVVDAIREARKVFDAHGGRECHCGGLIYPPAQPGGPERHTCTHGPDAPLTSAEIRAIRNAWAASTPAPDPEPNDET
jgi:hypothetical protein